MAVQLPQCPDTLKGIIHYLNVASEHDGRDPTVSYWCRLYALQRSLVIDKSSDGAKFFLLRLMDWLENEKKTHHDNDTITNEGAAQAYVENYALKLFRWADGMDRNGTFNKNVIKAFYTAGILMEVLQTFGELSDDLVQNKKYAKWKAAYLNNCLKNGETPIAGPPASGEGSEGPSKDPYSASASDLPSPPSIKPNDNISSSNLPDTIPHSAFSNLMPTLPLPPKPSDLPEPSAAFVHSTHKDSPVTPQSPVAPPVSASDQPVTYIEAEYINKCQKYIKYASSALNYDDYNEAKKNLQKALDILNTGRDN